MQVVTIEFTVGQRFGGRDDGRGGCGARKRFKLVMARGYEVKATKWGAMLNVEWVRDLCAVFGILRNFLEFEVLTLVR